MCGSQDTALLYITVNLEGFRYFSIKANSAMHVYMKRCNDAQKFEQPSPAEQLKGFGQIDKIKGLLLFPACCLQLSDRENHINSGSS